MSPRQILVIEDDPGIAALTLRQVERLGHRAVTASSGAQALERLAENRVDLLLLDIELPDMNGQELLRQLTRQHGPIPFIVTTGHGSEKVAVEMMKRGASDYIVKDETFWDHLRTALDRALEKIETEERLKSAEHALRRSEERLRAIFDNEAVGICIVSRAGLYLQCNRKWEEMLGYAADELLQRFVLDVTHPGDLDRVRIELDRLLNQESASLRLEKRFRRKDGRDFFWGDFSISPLYDPEGRLDAFVGMVVDIDERKRAEQEVLQLAYYDPLTRLPNRTLFHEHLHLALARSDRQNHQTALLFLDLDRFKDINDTLGHDRGDILLRDIGRRLKECVRESDTLARLGGDEFVLLLTPVESDREVVAVAQKILKVMAAPLDLAGKEIFISASIGVVLYPGDGGDCDTLLKHADMAMYAAKARGRNTFQLYSREMNQRTVERHELEGLLRRALDRNEMFLAFQPQLDLVQGRMVGCEALLRWRHPDKGLIGPARFIPLAEDIGLIRSLGEWVLRTACTLARRWQRAGFGDLPVAVNISGHQIREPDFIDTVDRILAETGLAPGLLELEMTESVLMEFNEGVLEALTDLKVRGIRLAIDDFGTGYSSLNYLKNFPFDRIKIAQSFVRDIPADRDDCAIIETIIAMARNLNLEVIAEGVEHLSQVDFLAARTCFLMQGFYFSRPIPAAEFEKLLAAGFGKPGVCLFSGELS